MGEKTRGRTRSKRIVRRSRQERRRLISAYRRSNQTQRAFAQRHGIKYMTFMGWLRKDRAGHRSSGVKSAGARFAEVTVQSSAVTEDRIEIVLGDPIRVEVDCGVAVEQVASLVKALRESGC